MTTQTTVRVSEPTLRWIISFKALLESQWMQIITLDVAILTAASVADYHLQKDIGVVKGDLRSFVDEKMKKIKEQSGKGDWGALFDQVESVQNLIQGR